MQSISSDTSSFADHCRFWRQQRGYSQLALATEADISQRHLSCLETERSKPSREMVIKLAITMDIPLRARNAMLNAAGFASVYSQHKLSAPQMSVVNEAINNVLAHHDPLPAIVVNRNWHIMALNSGAQKLFSLLGDPEEVWQAVEDNGNKSLARLTLHPGGLKPFIDNWEAAAPLFIERIRREIAFANDPALSEELQGVIDLVGQTNPAAPKTLLPVLPLELRQGELCLKLFSVFSNFGTPVDVTTEELRIESFYPSDEISRSFFDA